MKFFIPFDVSADINYIYLFCLLDLAEYNRTTKRHDRIEYRSIQELTDRIKKNYNIKISNATISRFLREMEAENNSCYLSIDRNQKTIQINNNFRNKKDIHFVVIDKRALHFLIQQKENLLCKYYLYLCYYCDITKEHNTDTTAKQFLDVSGYSTKSGNYISKLSYYNSLLVANSFITIQKHKDQKGHERNTYRIL